MKSYKAIKSCGTSYILSLTFMYDLLMIILLNYINSYEISNLIKIIFIVFNIYQLYYILLNTALVYEIDNDNVTIVGAHGLRKVIIPISSIQGYNKSSGKIKGIHLYGYGNNNFAFGKSIIEKIGIVSMYVTSGKNVLYLKTKNMVYGISPEKFEEFENKLIDGNIENWVWESVISRNVNLYKDKKFILPFILASIVILILTINPFVLYLTNNLPAEMPLKFDASFKAIKFGTGRQFAFKQMVYGVLNMALLCCMYYAAYFYARYDKKMSHIFMYISMLVASIFLVMQIKIILTF